MQRKIRRTEVVYDEPHKHKYNINMYVEAPQGISDLNELNILASERLRFYHVLRSAEHKPFSKEWIEVIEKQLINKNLTNFSVLLENSYGSDEIKARRADNISHWLLQLAFSRNQEMVHYFLTYELQWFLLRYLKMDQDKLNSFLRENGFMYIAVSEKEKQLLKKELLQSTRIDKDQFEGTTFYKEHFTKISIAVINRGVFLLNAYAYFLFDDIIFCVQQAFLIQLNKQIEHTSRFFSTYDNDRILNLLSKLSIEPDSSSCQGLSLTNIDYHATKHYPLCMSHIHNVFREKNHLKYDCKMQYGLFLKSIGLCYEDALVFWKEGFTKIMNEEWYEKKYSYLFKHQYGQVGSKITYYSYHCDEIQNSHVGAIQEHGCPFKHWGSGKLAEKCKDRGINEGGVKTILDLSAKGCYNAACRTYFNEVHNEKNLTLITNPCEYYKESLSCVGNCSDEEDDTF